MISVSAVIKAKNEALQIAEWTGPVQGLAAEVKKGDA